MPPGVSTTSCRPLRIAGLLRSQRGGDGVGCSPRTPPQSPLPTSSAPSKARWPRWRGIARTNSARQGSVNRSCRSGSRHAPPFDRCSNTSPSPTSPRASSDPHRPTGQRPRRLNPHTAADNAPQPGPTQPPGASPGWRQARHAQAQLTKFGSAGAEARPAIPIETPPLSEPFAATRPDQSRVERGKIPSRSGNVGAVSPNGLTMSSSVACSTPTSTTCRRFARRRSQWSAEADDITAEVFADSGGRRRNELPDPGVRLWLFGVAQHVFANHRRSNERQRRLQLRLIDSHRDDRPEIMDSPAERLRACLWRH